MELKEFIKNSLIQIDQAIEEASSSFTQYDYKYGTNPAGNQSIDFDIQVYASDASTSAGGVGINVAGLKLGSNGESNNSNYNFSKINFSVVRQNHLQKQKVIKQKFN